MFKPHYGTCSNCHKTDQLICVKAGYCQKCNYEKKQEDKKLRRTSGTSKNRIPIQSNFFKTKGSTGEKETFRKVAETQEHKCYVCGKQLGELTVSNFAHILPKALNKYPLFKLNIDNIFLFCHDSYGSCHHRFDKMPRSTLTEPMWNKVFELEEKLKEEYKLLKIK